MKLLPFALLAIAFAFSGMAYAAPSATSTSLQAFLAEYIPNSTIANYSYISSGSFVIMQNGNNYMVVSRNPYSFVTNSSTAYNALMNYSLALYNRNLTADIYTLNASVTSFVGQSMPSINECLLHTGINMSNACTASNFCYPCQQVPACSSLLSNTSTQPIATSAISNFSTQYYIYEKAFAAFSSSVSQVNSSNAYLHINAITSNASTLASVPAALLHNALFPVPSGFNMSLFKSCPYFVSLSSPWYCQSLNFCSRINFNSTLLAEISNEINAIKAIPLSSQKIYSDANAAVALANSYIEPVLQARKANAVAGLVNKLAPLYNSAMDNATAALSVSADPQLSVMANQLSSAFKNLSNNGIYMNLSNANSSIMKLVNEMAPLSSNILSSYYMLVNESKKLEALALKAELNYPSNAQIAEFAAKAQAYGLLLSNGINSSQLPVLKANMSLISNSLNALGSPFTLAMLVKSTDGWFASLLAYLIPGSIQSKMALAPFYAALLPFLIGIALLLLLYRLTYVRLSNKKRIKPSKEVKHAWLKLFLVLFIIVVIYSYITFAYASQANSFLPVSGFINSLHSPHLAILVNQNYAFNISVMSCVASIEQNMHNETNVSIIAENNMMCNMLSNSSVSSVDCINPLLLRGIPVVLINENGSYVSYKGMYGNMLYASGPATIGSSCTLSYLLKQ